ncbi:MAG: xanthan lyase, partial [Alistipes sp.]|nr:xanthan lyase [Alistipes sp.]
DRDFAEKVLKVRFGGGMASRSGKVRTQPSRLSRKKMAFTFNTQPSEEVYPVESPEVVQPADKRAFTILRYDESQESAAVAYDGAYRSIVVGFPLETITDDKERGKFIESALDYLINRQQN